MAAPQLVSIEFTVPDLGPCIALFRDVLGMTIRGPERHPVLDASLVQVETGAIVLTLLCPTDTGNGVPHSFPDPRLSQLNFALPADELAAVRSRLEEAGAAVVDHRELFVVDPELVKGLLGADAALVFTAGVDTAPPADP